MINSPQAGQQPTGSPVAESEQRSCVLCGAGSLTNEHVWPQWLRSLPGMAAAMEEKQGGPGIYVYFNEAKLDVDGGYSVIRPELRVGSNHPTDITVKVLCKDCNNNILSARERAIKGVLSSMIAGEAMSLDHETLVRVAAWATKTAMMFEFNDPGTAAFSPQQRRALRAGEKPPEDTDVWMGRYSGEQTFRTLHSGYAIEEVPEGTSIPSTLASLEPVGEVWGRIGFTRLAVGSLALFIASTNPPPERAALTGAFPTLGEGWVRIWPNTPQRVELPLVLGVGDQDVDALAYLRPPKDGIVVDRSER